MDVHTGEILAMVSLPTYDNNLFSETLGEEELDILLSDPAKPLVNHAIAEMYPPGSSFKPITGLAALQEGVATPSTTIVSHGYITVTNEYDPSVVYVFHDWAALGTLDFYGGISWSSDVYFYYLAGGKQDEGFQGLGEERLARYARSFGLGEPTGVSLPGESAGLVPDAKWKERTVGEMWYVGDTYYFGIGQGYLAVTPLQLLNAVVAIANGGELLRPQLVKETRDSHDHVVATLAKEVRRRLPVDQEYLAVMREAMRQSVSTGVAKSAQVPGLAVAGKTGTAEFGAAGEDEGYETHGWFVGFAPYEDPEIAVVVFVQRGGGGQNSAPAAARIFDYYFNQRYVAEQEAP
jgi:penicillin-binding protein 2